MDSDGVVDEAEADVFTKINDINKKLSTAMDKLMEEDAVDQQPPAAESPAVKETSESAGLKDEFYAGSQVKIEPASKVVTSPKIS